MRKPSDEWKWNGGDQGRYWESQYMHKYNFSFAHKYNSPYAHKKSAAYPAQIFMEFIKIISISFRSLQLNFTQITQ